MHHWWEYKMVLVWKTLAASRKFKTHIHLWLSNLIPRYLPPKNNRFPQKTWLRIFGDFSHNSQKVKAMSKCPSIGKEINKLRCFHAKAYYSNKKQELWIQTSKSINIKTITLSKRQAQRAYTLWFHLYEVQEPTKLIYIDRNQNDGCLGILEGGVITERDARHF